MSTTKQNGQTKSLRTRESLVERLRQSDDEASWREFYDLYQRLIRGLAIKCGLSEDEASEVVQETMLTVSKMIEGYEYDRKRCSFRGWIFHKARWRIADQLRKRPPEGAGPEVRRLADSTRTDTVETIPDPHSDELDAAWEREWKGDLLKRAIERVKQRVKAKQFQIFDLYVLQGCSVPEIRRMLDISATQVYLAKHRISGLVRKEMQKLEAALG